MKREKLTITQEDIDEGIDRMRYGGTRGGNCPAAIALKRQHPEVDYVYVGGIYARMEAKNDWSDTFPHSRRLSRFIREFDTHGTAKPGSFMLRWKE